jgi:daunorubicin resistance ABC transporter ATP-binding subunit
MERPVIVAEGLVKQFGTTRALDGLDLAVPAGTVVGVLGPNGAGKTTAVRILSTLLVPDGGQAWVGGHDVAKDPASIRPLIGLTGQYAAVDELISGFENLFMIGRLNGLPKADARQRAHELLESFDLVEAGDKVAKTYSGGMRRRLDLAVSLVARPQILFLDEPTTGLDPRARLHLWDLIRDLVAGGMTVLLTTQYLDEADQLASSVVVVDHGRVVAAGTPDELKSRVGGQVVEIRTVHREDVIRASGLLGRMAGADTTIDMDDHLVRVPVANAGMLGAALRHLDEAGLAIVDAAVRRPTLDEVFLALTGHVAEEQPEPEPAKEGIR